MVSTPTVIDMKFLTLLFPLLLAGCGSSPEVMKDVQGNEIPEPFKDAGGTASSTDIARFLGGRPVQHGAQLSQLQQTLEYRAFSNDMLVRWKTRTTRRIAAQNEWQAANIAPLTGSAHTVVYPFGGPDLLYVMSMFPRSSRYVLLGLEPAGAYPDLEHASPGSVIGSLGRHAKSMETELMYGYFITKDMRAELSNGALQGVTPILLASLGLMNATVNSVQSTSAGGKSAVEIDFTLPQWGRKSVIYVSGDLSNSGFGGSYQSWLSSAGSGSIAYFKAASYLMQESGFSGIRNWVLGNCRAVVQDDSGIPYSAYDKQKWDMHLFGNYYGPIELFANHGQSDLRAAYAAAGPVPGLNFGSGYQMIPSRANLMVATRR